MKIKIKPLDALFSTYIRTKAKWKCERCGTYYEPPTTALHCSHYWGRSRKSVRWDEENCCALCYGCHRHLGSNPTLHTDFFLKRLGQERFDKLMIRANGVGVNLDLVLIKEALKRALKKLNG